jgi:oligoribonuclease
VASAVTQAEAEARTLEFVKKFAGPKEAPLAGNSVWQDRRFLCRYMRDLDAHLHYRLVDVSTVKELAARWSPEAKFVKAKGLHRALEDIRESVAELKYYRDVLFRTGGEVTAKLAALRADAGGAGG